MDKKKKNGVNVSDDQDSKSERDSRPTPTQAGSGDGDRARTSTSASSDKDSSKAHSHAPEDANKQGPQKKRRKVTHGTALLLSYFQPSFLPGCLIFRALTLCLRVPTACVYCRRSVSQENFPIVAGQLAAVGADYCPGRGLQQRLAQWHACGRPFLGGGNSNAWLILFFWTITAYDMRPRM